MTFKTVRTVATGAVAVLMMASASAQAQVVSGDWGAIGATVAATSDYVFRGISQTKGHPALQGSVEYTKELGPVTPYAGAFLSNAKFPDTVNGGNLPITKELDYDAGVRGTIEKFGWDVGIIRISYPGSDMPRNNSLDFDWTEIYGKVNYDFGFAKLAGGWWHSAHYSSGAGKGNYVGSDLTVPMPFLFDINATGHIGHLGIKNEVNFGLPSYTDWSLGLNRDMPEILGVNIALNYSDTNISKRDRLHNDIDNTNAILDDRFYKTAKPRVVLTVSKTF